MKYGSIALTAAALAMGLGASACSKKSAAPSASEAASMDSDMPAEESGGTDVAKGETLAPESKAAMFLTAAMKGDNSEVRAGKLAADKGSSQAVRDFGKMLAADHGKAGKAVAALASSLGVQASTATTPEADATYAKLQGLSGGAFDKEFARAMVEDHQNDIAAFQAEADSKDPVAVTDLAKKTLPTLKHHLEVAKSLGS